MAEEFPLRLGEAKSHWLKNDKPSNQFSRQVEIFAANAKMY